MLILWTQCLARSQRCLLPQFFIWRNESEMVLSAIEQRSRYNPFDILSPPILYCSNILACFVSWCPSDHTVQLKFHSSLSHQKQNWSKNQHKPTYELEYKLFIKGSIDHRNTNCSFSINQSVCVCLQYIDK